MQKKFKHVKLGWIAKEDNEVEGFLSIEQKDEIGIPKWVHRKLIENSSDWVEVKEKEYPSEFGHDYDNYDVINSFNSAKYAVKLETLDTLLCLRDSYNEIDGFVPNFDGYSIIPCICNVNNNLKVDSGVSISHPFAFKTIKTGELFLNNFRTQLEEVKELL